MWSKAKIFTDIDKPAERRQCTPILKLIDIMAKEVKILDVESVISAHVKQQMDDHNHEYYLREQLKAIREELGEDRFDEID